MTVSVKCLHFTLFCAYSHVYSAMCVRVVYTGLSFHNITAVVHLILEPLHALSLIGFHFESWWMFGAICCQLTCHCVTAVQDSEGVEPVAKAWCLLSSSGTATAGHGW